MSKRMRRWSLIASAFLIALGSVLSRYALSADGGSDGRVDPLLFLTLQLLGGVVFLCGAQRLSGRRWEWPPGLRRLALSGIVIGVGSVGAIMALALISASEASLVFATQPMFVLTFAWFLLGERFSATVVAMSLVAAGGVAMIIISGAENAPADRPAGLAFAAMSTACAALYIVRMRALVDEVDMLTALIVVQAVACPFAFAAWAAAAVVGWADAGMDVASFMGPALGTGVIYYGAAYYAYLIGLRKTPAATAGVYLSLVPVFAIALARAILSETLGAVQWIGAALVIAAVAGVSAESGRQRQ